MVDLSICIPTYNRSYYLDNCLNSIKLAIEETDLNVEVCISDNYSEEKIDRIIKKYMKHFKIIFNKNSRNYGMGKNILKAVSMASGKFCWLLGNDDLLLPSSLKKISELFKSYKDVDFYYINSFQFNSKELLNYDHPIDMKKIRTDDLKRFSNFSKSSKLDFFELINPKKSYEFMLSFFLCIFRRKYWFENLNVIDNDKINDENQYSTFDNTAPHSKIWARGFKNKKAYFHSYPLTINVHGPRAKDWGNLYPFIEGIRIPQLLDIFRKEGLPFTHYIRCKNYALRKLLPSFFFMIKNKNISNFKYVNIRKDLFYNLIYPMVYFSVFIWIFKKLITFFRKI